MKKPVKKKKEEKKPENTFKFPPPHCSKCGKDFGNDHSLERWHNCN